MIKSVTEFLDRAAKENPSKIVFIEEGKTITYAELRDNALRAAGFLIKNKIRNSAVAIYDSGTIDSIVWMLGVAYSGNYYSIFSHEWGQNRIKKGIEIFNPRIVITKTRIDELLPDNYRGEEYCPSEIHKLILDEEAVLRVASMILPTDVFSVIFTSGSTGEPKGVGITHGAMIENALISLEALGVNDSFRFGVLSSFEFAIPSANVYWILASCASGYIIPQHLFYNPDRLMMALNENDVSALFWSAFALKLCSEYFQKESLSGQDAEKAIKGKLKFVGSCGGGITGLLVNSWRKRFPGLTFINTYGSTEALLCTKYVCHGDYPENEMLPIGKPVGDISIALLNQEKVIATNEEKGILCVSVSANSHGYWKDREGAGKRFISGLDNHDKSKKFFITGDLVLKNDAGDYVFAGREDLMIKHHGYRVQPEEIERETSKIEAVGTSVILFDEILDQLILVYEGQAEPMKVLREMKGKFPRYMIPSKVIPNYTIPLTATGKVDRQKLKIQCLFSEEKK